MPGRRDGCGGDDPVYSKSTYFSSKIAVCPQIGVPVLVVDVKRLDDPGSFITIIVTVSNC
jgi:hypothetical protein